MLSNEPSAPAATRNIVDGCTFALNWYARSAEAYADALARVSDPDLEQLRQRLAVARWVAQQCPSSDRLLAQLVALLASTIPVPEVWDRTLVAHEARTMLAAWHLARGTLPDRALEGPAGSGTTGTPRG